MFVFRNKEVGGSGDLGPEVAFETIDDISGPLLSGPCFMALYSTQFSPQQMRGLLDGFQIAWM